MARKRSKRASKTVGRKRQAQRQGTRRTNGTQGTAEGYDQRLGGRSRRRRSTERRPRHPKCRKFREETSGAPRLTKRSP
jgi:hypothetical protein